MSERVIAFCDICNQGQESIHRLGRGYAYCSQREAVQDLGWAWVLPKKNGKVTCEACVEDEMLHAAGR